MLRKITLKNTKTQEAITMPVTPPDFAVERGRRVDNISMAQTGEVNLPGLRMLFNHQMEFLLPSSARNYADTGWTGQAWLTADRLSEWAENGDVVRFIVSGTSVNVPVLLESVTAGEEDGTNDVVVKIVFREYRYLTAETVVQAATGNTSRPSETATAAVTTYTVKKGDTLWGIARKYYGNGSPCYKLATWNGIKNANLIYPGQKITIPDKGQL